MYYLLIIISILIFKIVTYILYYFIGPFFENSYRVILSFIDTCYVLYIFFLRLK